MAAVSQIPTITTDLQRSTRYCDVNCQKTMGIVTNVLSLFSSMSALMAFRNSCYSSLPTDLSGHGTLHWSIGIGFPLSMFVVGDILHRISQ